MKTLLAISALGLGVAFSTAPVFAHAPSATKSVTDRWHSPAYASVDPAGSGDFAYGPGRAPYGPAGGDSVDFQLQGR